MSAAFEAVGYKQPHDRLMAWAVEAWGKYPMAAEAGARRDYICAQLRCDPTWCLGERYGSVRVMTDWVTALLYHAREMIEAQKPKQVPAERSGEGAIGQAIPIVGSPLREVVAGGGQDCSEPQSPRAPAGKPAAVTRAELGRRQQAANARRVAVAVERSRLDSVLIDGRPIGDCTVAEVRAWAESRRATAREAARDVRFALSLTANLPSGERLRDWWRDVQEVDRMYERAERDAEVAA